MLAVVAFAASLAIPTSLAAVRAPLALPLVFALPGYALVSVLFKPADLRAWDIALLSIAISIATSIVSGLVLDAIGVRLSGALWIGALAAVTVAAAARGAELGHARTIRLPHVALKRSELGALAAALVLLGGAAVLGFTPLSAPKGTQGSTALSILPAGPASVALRVASDELHSTTYTVELTVAGRPRRHFGPIRLAPGATWNRAVMVGPGYPLVQAFLRTAGDPKVLDGNVVLRPGAPAWAAAAPR